jgi:hypothetical protein
VSIGRKGGDARPTSADLTTLVSNEIRGGIFDDEEPIVTAAGGGRGVGLDSPALGLVDFIKMCRNEGRTRIL